MCFALYEVEPSITAKAVVGRRGRSRVCPEAIGVHGRLRMGAQGTSRGVAAVERLVYDDGDRLAFRTASGPT